MPVPLPSGNALTTILTRIEMAINPSFLKQIRRIQSLLFNTCSVAFARETTFKQGAIT